MAPLMVSMLMALAGHGRDGVPPWSDWRQMRSEEGITAYAADSPSGPMGAAEGLIRSRPEQILGQLISFATMAAEVPRVAEARVLERSSNDALVYVRLDLPWPISDRDYTVRYRWDRRPDGSIEIAIDDAPDRHPTDTNAVRVIGTKGRFVITPAATGSSVTYLFSADFGGSLPDSVKLQVLWKQPLRTLQGVRRILEPGD